MNILEDIQQAFETLKNGGSILYPTDTVWGLGCDATNEKAVQKIYEIKKRPPHKSYIILVSNMRQLLKYISAPPMHIDDIILSYKVPTTFILDGAINLPDNLVNDDGSIAIRIPKDDFCLRLLKKFGKPIVSTSANMSGMPTARIFPELDQQVINAVDYVATHRRRDRTIVQPSTIVKIHADGSQTTIRA